MANSRMSDPREAYLRKLQTLRQKYTANKNDKATRAKDEIIKNSTTTNNNNKKSKKRSSINTDSGVDEESISYSEASESYTTDSYIEDSKRVYQQQRQHEMEDQKSPSSSAQHHNHQLVHHTQALIPMKDPHQQHHAMAMAKGGGGGGGPPSVAPSCHNSQYTQHTETTHAHSTTLGETNLFLIPPGTRLSPRADVWFLLAFLSSACIASLAEGTSPQQTRTSYESMALVLTSMQLIISALVAMGYRYAPSRFALTKGKFETILSIFQLVLVTVDTSIVMNPQEYIGMGGDSIWNANVFYCTWISLYASSYLVGDLTTTDNHFGTVCQGYAPVNSTAKLWFSLIVSSVAMGGVSLRVQTSSACSGILVETPYCERALLACFVGFLCMATGVIALGIYRLSLLGDKLYLYYNVNNAPMRWFDGEMRAKKTARILGTLLSFVVFLLNCICVALVNGPKGPGFEPGSVFATTWMSFVWSLILGKKYVESYLVPLPRNVPQVPIAQVSVSKGAAVNAAGGVRGGVEMGGGGGGGGGSWKDASFNSRKTDVTDMDDSSKNCDDYDEEEEHDHEHQEFHAIEDGSMSRTNQSNAASGMSTPKHDNAKRAQSVASSISSGYTGPVIGVKDSPSVVSSLGQSRYTLDPAGCKAGFSYYGGDDAGGAEAQAQSVQQGGAEPSQSFGQSSHVGPDAPSRQQSMYGGNMYPQDRDQDSASAQEPSGNSYVPQTPKGAAPYGRRGSFTSKPHLSPLQEASQEGESQTTKSSSANGSSRKSNANNRSPTVQRAKANSQKGSSSKRSVRSSGTGKRSKSSSKASFPSRQQQQPQPPQQQQHGNHHGRGLYPPQGIDNQSEGSLSIPLTEEEGSPSAVANQSREPSNNKILPPPPRGSMSPETAKSDFDIIVSDNSSVVTELTNEGFDAPPHLTATKQAGGRNGNGASPGRRSGLERGISARDLYEQPPQQQQPPPPPPPPQLPKGFPQRMPLYNGSDASMTSQSEYTGFQARDRICVDALVASALAHARNINDGLSHSNGGEGSISTQEASSADPSSYHRGGGGGGVGGGRGEGGGGGGGASRGGISSGSGEKSGSGTETSSRSQSRGKNGSNGRQKQRPSSTSRNGKRSSKSSSFHKSTNSNNNNRPRSVPNQRYPSRGRNDHHDQSYNSSSLCPTDYTEDEEEQSHRMKPPANGGSNNNTKDYRRKSIQSFYSETGTIESMGEFAC